MTKYIENWNINYPLIATLNGQEEVFYESYGDYQGEWLLITYADNVFYVYTGGYGSCSYCDYAMSVQESYGYGESVDIELLKEDFSDYKPFVEFSADVAETLLEDGTLETLFPKNLGWHGGIDYREPIESIRGLLRRE